MKDNIAVLQHNAPNKSEVDHPVGAIYQKCRDKRKKISKYVRQHVVDKQENACGMCKLDLTTYFELDHIVGLQFGGTDDEENLMAQGRVVHLPIFCSLFVFLCFLLYSEYNVFFLLLLAKLIRVVQGLTPPPILYVCLIKELVFSPVLGGAYPITIDIRFTIVPIIR